MRIEPDIDKAALIEKLHQEYALDIESLVFLPEGMIAYCYFVIPVTS
jgi:hypothetical protein